MYASKTDTFSRRAALSPRPTRLPAASPLSRTDVRRIVAELIG